MTKKHDYYLTLRTLLSAPFTKLAVNGAESGISSNYTILFPSSKYVNVSTQVVNYVFNTFQNDERNNGRFPNYRIH